MKTALPVSPAQELPSDPSVAAGVPCGGLPSARSLLRVDQTRNQPPVEIITTSRRMQEVVALLRRVVDCRVTVSP